MELGNREIIRSLIDHGINCNVQSESFGETPLLLAAEKNELELVKLLLSHTSEEMLHICRGIMATTALTYAFMHQNEEMIELLLKAGANPYFREWDQLNEYLIELMG